jgi:magnesium transporter
MRRRRRKTTRVGAPPGTLQVDPQAPRPVITVLAYGNDQVLEQKVEDLGTLPALRQVWPKIWLNIDGLGDQRVIENLGSMFNIHPLTLEDIVNVRQRPKVEEFEHYQFVVMRVIAADRPLSTVQMSLLVGDNFVLTFCEREDNYFGAVRERLTKKGPRIGQAGAEYLAYCLIDALVDCYFPILEDCGEQADSLQEEVLLRPTVDTAWRINDLKRDFIELRRAVWPLRDELNGLMRSKRFQQGDTATYLRDTHDHAIMLIDILESGREINNGLMDLYLSSVSNRMNEVMKVLTIISTVFIPLTFITGLYGMNFNPEASPYNMPELNWYWGYPSALLSLLLTGIGISVFMWRLGWFRPTTIAPTSR